MPIASSVPRGTTPQELPSHYSFPPGERRGAKPCRFADHPTASVTPVHSRRKRRLAFPGIARACPPPEGSSIARKSRFPVHPAHRLEAIDQRNCRNRESRPRVSGSGLYRLASGAAARLGYLLVVLGQDLTTPWSHRPRGAGDRYAYFEGELEPGWVCARLGFCYNCWTSRSSFDLFSRQ